MSGYSGTEVEKHSVKSTIDEENLSHVYAERIRTVGKEKILTDIEKRRLEEYLEEGTKLKKGTPAGNIIGALILLVIIVVPLIITYHGGNIGLGIGWTVLMLAVMVVYFILDKMGRTAFGAKLDLVKDGRYKAYILPVTDKRWYRYTVGKRSHRRTIYRFFLLSEGLIFSVDAVTYEETTDQVIAALFFSDEATSLLIMPAKKIVTESGGM